MDTLDWKEYEKIAAQIYKTISPQAEVRHNEKIFGQSSKIARQIDVSIRQDVGAHKMLIVVQCKKLKNKVDVNDVGELVSVVEDVRANMGVIVSNSGFTEGAINLARDKGVELCSLYDAQNKNWKDMLKIPVLCIVARPVQVRGRLDFIGVQNTAIPGDPSRWKFEDKKFFELFVEDWNTKKIDPLPGKHLYQCSKQDLKISAIDNSIIPVRLSFEVDVSREFRFGYLGISDSQGVVKPDGSYTTKEILTDWMDIAEVCNKWRLLNSEKDVPQQPLVTMHAWAWLGSELFFS